MKMIGVSSYGKNKAPSSNSLDNYKISRNASRKSISQVKEEPDQSAKDEVIKQISDSSNKF